MGVGVGSGAGGREPDTPGRASAGDLSEESEEHDERAETTAATKTATTAADDVLRIMVAMKPHPDRDPSRPGLMPPRCRSADPDLPFTTSNCA